jgi:hypothetical protein
MTGLLTRRRAFAAAAGRVDAILVTSRSNSSASPSPSGSTRETTWGDRAGDGQLRVTAGEPLVARTELGEGAPLRRTLATIAHMTDAHVMDASSPARVTFLARLGPPFQTTFRPQEALTVQVLAGAVRAIRVLAPDLVIQGGDLIDNVQGNELEAALAVLGGGDVNPGSGRDGYCGVQSEINADPLYYRPAVDPPVHPALLRDAVRRFRSHGLGAPWVPVLGDHDILVQGELVPTELTRRLATGDRARWTLPEGLSLPPGLKLEAGGASDGAPPAGLVEQFLAAALQGTTVAVPPDPGRRELAVEEAVARLRTDAAASFRSKPAPVPGLGSGDRLDFVHDLGDRLRVVVLDLASRIGGSAGRVVPGQVEFLERAISGADRRWIVVAIHQTLRQTVGAEELEAVLDASPRVVLTLAGHTHQNRIRPRETPAGGYWTIETSSLVDWPQQARALRLYETEDGGIAIETWMLDHVSDGWLGPVARGLSLLDDGGGRLRNFAGAPRDRNALLYRRGS